jgi:hypothetical protein
MMMLVGCASTPPAGVSVAQGKTVCDSYIVMDMCVQDLMGDGTVDMVYFTDTNEVFMYQAGRQDAVGEVMPFHRCAVPLNAGMQSTTNQILERENLSLTEELDITRRLIANYVAAKPTIDACNARFTQKDPDKPAQKDDFFISGSDWDEQ